jgi:hypothetical protein
MYVENMTGIHKEYDWSRYQPRLISNFGKYMPLVDIHGHHMDSNSLKNSAPNILN